MAMHDYPQEEVEMSQFYNGKRCVFTRKLDGVEWAHMLDPESGTSNDRVRQSLITIQLSDVEYAPISSQ
jgi:hypothetical protein